MYQIGSHVTMVGLRVIQDFFLLFSVKLYKINVYIFMSIHLYSTNIL